jgi:hypothetical protein
MTGDGTFWREKVVFDDLHSAVQGLMDLEIATVSQPLHFPYQNAVEKLLPLIQELSQQAENARKNSYYKQGKGR